MKSKAQKGSAAGGQGSILSITPSEKKSLFISLCFIFLFLLKLSINLHEHFSETRIFGMCNHKNLSTSCLWIIHCGKWTCRLVRPTENNVFNSGKCGGEAKDAEKQYLLCITIAWLFSENLLLALLLILGCQSQSVWTHQGQSALCKFHGGRKADWKPQRLVLKRKLTHPHVGSIFYIRKFKIVIYTTIWPH